MTARDFCYWLQGVFEIADLKTLDAKQTDLVKRHLAMVFLHEIDPSFPKEQQPSLDAAHAGTVNNAVTTLLQKEIEERLKKLEERPPIVFRPPSDTKIRC